MVPIQQGQLQLGAVDEPIRRRPKKYRSIEEIMRVTECMFVDEEMRSCGDDDYYSCVTCEECGTGERGDEMLLCNKGYHMLCARPIVTRIPLQCENLDAKKRRRGSSTLVICKRRRRTVPYIASEDPARRLAQMRSLAYALMNNGMEFSNELTYMLDMAPRSANQAILESGALQSAMRAMHRRGEYPPLLVTFDSRKGYTVQAEGPIKDFTLLGESTGDVDYMRNREHDDCDSLMTLLLATDERKAERSRTLNLSDRT